MSSCLDNLCGDDSALRLEVENLLALKDDPELGLLESAAVPLAMEEAAAARSAWIGRRVGSYEIVEEIGAGGMGEVYRAIRADDQFHKQVAIKLVRVGYDSDFIVARFRTERQVLAGLEHPNIARLLDGGTTKEGIPYFAMELIDGQPLYEYCDSRELNTSDRLRLFLQICSAVQYAHQRLIVHRDLKPGNILVTADGTPKLLDFGIAKILESASTSESSQATETIFRFLTPEYASPEQIRGEAVTTSSDVYSLGLLLYEILTGHRPYRAIGDAPHEIARAICETVPERPSAIVLRSGQGPKNGTTSEFTPAVVSAVREETPQKLSRRLRGDLDNILLTAILSIFRFQPQATPSDTACRSSSRGTRRASRRPHSLCSWCLRERRHRSTRPTVRARTNSAPNGASTTSAPWRTPCCSTFTMRSGICRGPHR
jgi:serine/threonine protein kinase